MSYILPSPLPLLPGESLASLVVRNAEAYRFRDPMRLLRRIAPPVKDLAALSMARLDEVFGESLRALLGLDPADFARLSHGAIGDDGPRFFGHGVHADLIAVRNRRWCPLCLREAAYWRTVWELSVVTVCPEHGVLLADRCPECGRRVGWTRAPSIHQCPLPRCRADLREAPTVAVPRSALTGVTALLAHLDSGDIGKDRFSVGDALRLSFSLGAMACGHARMPRPHIFALEHPELVPAILDNGWAVLEDWPVGFHRLLDRLRNEASGRTGKYGIVKEFGSVLPRFIAGSAGEPFGQRLADAFNDYVAAQPDLATRVGEIRRRRSAEGLVNRYINLNDATELFGTSQEHMRVLAEQYHLFLVAPTGSGSASLLRADKVKQLHIEAMQMLTKQSAYRVSNSMLLVSSVTALEGILHQTTDGFDDNFCLKPVGG